MNVECMLKVSQTVPIPIAAGERLHTRFGSREYVEKQAIDILPAGHWAGGRHHGAEKHLGHGGDVRPSHAAAPLCGSTDDRGPGAARCLHYQLLHPGAPPVPGAGRQ